MSKLRDPGAREVRPTQTRVGNAPSSHEAWRRRADYYRTWSERYWCALETLADQDERMARRLMR